jgi:curved DNA-binding protein CbpA
MSDLYSVLGVPRSVSKRDLRSAYRRLAQLYHPDKTGGDKDKEAKFKEINAAYEILGDVRKRLEYDAAGRWETPRSHWETPPRSAGTSGPPPRSAGTSGTHATPPGSAGDWKRSTPADGGDWSIVVRQFFDVTVAGIPLSEHNRLAEEAVRSIIRMQQTNSPEGPGDRAVRNVADVTMMGSITPELIKEWLLYQYPTIYTRPDGGLYKPGNGW